MIDLNVTRGFEIIDKIRKFFGDELLPGSFRIVDNPSNGYIHLYWRGNYEKEVLAIDLKIDTENLTDSIIPIDDYIVKIFSDEYNILLEERKKKK